MSRREYVALLFVICLSLLPLSQAQSQEAACVCGRVNFATAYEEADAVFQGRVVLSRVRTDGSGQQYREVTFAVENSWKGIDEELVIAHSWMGSCEPRFTDNESYLVYANRRGNSGPFSIGMCSSTSRAAEVEQDISYLDSNYNRIKLESADDTTLIVIPITGDTRRAIGTGVLMLVMLGTGVYIGRYTYPTNRNVE